MTVTIPRVNSTLSTINARLPNIDLVNAGTDVTSENLASNYSLLGNEFGDVIAGIRSLTTEVDGPNEAEIIEGIGLVGVTDGVPGIEDNVVGVVPGPDKEAIDAITGSDEGSKPGLVIEYFGGNSIAAIAALLALATGKSHPQLLPILQALMRNDLKGFVLNSIQRELGVVFAPILQKFNQALKDFIPGDIIAVVENVVDKLDRPIADVLQELADGKLKPDVLAAVILSIENEEFQKAIQLIAAVSTKDISVIEETILGLSTNVSDRVETVDPYSNLPDFEIGEVSQSWNGNQTQTSGGEAYSFAQVTSTEELEAELRATSRDISEVVVHWLGTFIDQNVGARYSHNIGLQRGFAGSPYHYIIKRDGTIERARPINLEGQHAPEGGHNKYSIGIAFAGGYNCLSGTADFENYLSPTSIAVAQWDTLHKFIGTFYKVFPYGNVYGHNDVDPNKPDPGIDMGYYVLSKFSKSNIPVGDAPIEPEQTVMYDNSGPQ